MEILPYTRGCKRTALQVAGDPTARAAAREELQGRVFSQTTKGPLAAKAALWEELAAAAGYSDPYEIDPELFYDIAGALWKAGYRLIRHGNLPEVFALRLRRVSRAAARG